MYNDRCDEVNSREVNKALPAEVPRIEGLAVMVYYMKVPYDDCVFESDVSESVVNLKIINLFANNSDYI